MSGLVEWYNNVMYTKNDPRTEDWFLVSAPGPLAIILVSYVYFCTSAGPRYMKNRKPYELRNVLIVYNFLQVLFSIYLFSEGLLSGWLYDYSYTCQPVDYSDNPQALRMARAAHLYFLCKLIELLDTVFFVLRKKNRQISALHVYHHSLMPFCGWIGVRFLPNGHVTLLGVINTFIHVIMYTYYLLSSIGPSMSKYLWWKKYLTSLQLIQFCIIFVHTLQVFFNGCNLPKVLMFLLLVNTMVFIYMFGSFYVENYIKNQRSKENSVEERVKNGGKNVANNKTE